MLAFTMLSQRLDKMLDHYRVFYLIFVGRVEWNFTYLVVSLSKLNHIANREFHTLEEG